MTVVENALFVLAHTSSKADRAFHLTGLISSLFRLRGVSLLVTGDVAYASYARRCVDQPEIDLAAFGGKLSPRLLQEIMGHDLRAAGQGTRWTLLEIPVRFQWESGVALRNLCRDVKTDYGYIKLCPAEELTAERVVAAVFPSDGNEARGEALRLLTLGLVQAFDMNWIALRELCHKPGYHVGDELTDLRMQAKREADARGLIPDQIGESSSVGLRIVEESDVLAN